MEFIKTFEEACSKLSLDPLQILPNLSFYPKTHQKSVIAISKLFIIAEAVNEGWKPNWNDRSQYKWFPWFDMEVDENNPSGFRFYASGYVLSFTGTAGGSRLCFKTKEKSNHVGKIFIDLFRDIMVL